MGKHLKMKRLRILLELSLLRTILSETYTSYTFNDLHTLGSISTNNGAKTSWASYRNISTREGRIFCDACNYKQAFYPSGAVLPPHHVYLKGFWSYLA